MPRNTLVVVILLAVFTAIVTGVNITRIITGESAVLTAVTPAPTPIPSPSPLPATQLFTDNYCRISFSYPSGLTEYPVTSGSAMIIDINNPNRVIMVSCAETLPEPKSETSGEIRVASVSAVLFSQEATDSGTMSSLFFDHPGTNLETLVVFPTDMGEVILPDFKIL